jgi:hypothetical protein
LTPARGSQELSVENSHITSNPVLVDFIARFSSLACKSGSVAGDGTAVSTTANSVFQTHVEAEAI